jgi:hypothetical protein
LRKTFTFYRRILPDEKPQNLTHLLIPRRLISVSFYRIYKFFLVLVNNN